MKKIDGNSEYKQRINLSNYAYTVIMQDLDNYAPGASMSGFFNDIIEAYRKKIEASIDVQVEKHKKHLLTYFPEMKTDPRIKKLIEDYRTQLIQEAYTSSAPKGESILFRLNKKNFEMLYGSDKHPGIEAINYIRPSIYLKALFEEFAKLPSVTRERLYFRTLIKEIENSAIPNGYMLNVTIGSHVYRVRPYKILQDTELSHLYLAGISKCISSPGPERIASFRLSNLQGNTILLDELATQKLSKNEAANIDDKIRKVGVQYLVADNSAEIKLRFHHSGEKMFRKKTQLRPVPIKVTEDGEYTFACSTQQIANYFFSFGKHVEILEPEDLRKAFIAGYQNACELYTKSAR